MAGGIEGGVVAVERKAGLAVLVFELVQTHGIVALGPVVLLAGLIQVVAGVTGLGMWFRMVSPAQVHHAAGDIAVLKQYGVPFEVLDADGCIRAEPGLGQVRGIIAGGLRLPAAQLSLAAGASLRVEGMEQAVTAALKLVENPERRAAMAQAAQAFASSNRGAAERTAAAVLAIAQAAEPVDTVNAPLEEDQPPRAEPTLD
eukprot:gene14795-19566_t